MLSAKRGIKGVYNYMKKMPKIGKIDLYISNSVKRSRTKTAVSSLNMIPKPKGKMFLFKELSALRH